MKTKKKKLIKLESELKVYNKIAMKLAEVLDAKLSVEELDDYIFLKIRKIENEINNIGLDDEVKDLAPEYGPGDYISYDNMRNEILEVHHNVKKYKIKSWNDVVFISWSDEKIKKWK